MMVLSLWPGILEIKKCLTTRAPIGLDMDRIQDLSNPYPFRNGLSNPYPIYPLNPWITWIGCGNGHVEQEI
jgi:hypothetical protein